MTANGWKGSVGRNLYLEENTEMGGWISGLIRPLHSSMAPGQMGCLISTLWAWLSAREREGLILTCPCVQCHPTPLTPWPSCHSQLQWEEKLAGFQSQGWGEAWHCWDGANTTKGGVCVRVCF